MQEVERRAYQFGPFLLDVAERQLLNDGHRLLLTPKVFEVLRVLVQHSGHLVEKDRLLAEVWPDSVVEEGALSRSISILRKTLGEDGSELKYIETVPTRGYRFVAPVTEQVLGEAAEALAEPAGRADAATPASLAAAILDAPTTRPSWLNTVWWVAGGAGVLLITGALLHAVLGRSGRETSALTTLAPVHQQVTFTGKERAPAISPDGNRIAYVSYEKPEKKLVVQELAGGQPLTIFRAPEIGYLRWSPNGTELIVWARGSGMSGVYVLPQLGGTPRRIMGGQAIACWSPDGSTIAVGSYLNGIIWFFEKSGRLQRTVSLRDVNGSIWDIDWSANGVLTFVSSNFQGRYTIWTVKPDGSEQRLVVGAGSEIPSARWAPTGDSIYYFRRLNQTFSLVKVSVATARNTPDAVPTTLVAGIESDRFLALSGDGHRLVYARAPYYSNLWLVETDSGGQTRTRELTHGTSLVERPSISPDETSIVFNIGHEPVANLYTMPITGGVPKQLTFRDSLNLEPVWSADGKRIAFVSVEGGQPGVWAIRADGGEPLALPSTDLSETFDLAWSPGPRVLYQQSGNRNYYELEPDTRARRLLVNDSSVGWIFSPVYSPDGRSLAVHWNRPRDRPAHRGIYIIDARTRGERLVYATPPAGTSASSSMPVAWSADGRSIYVLEGMALTFRGLTAPGGETMTEARIVRVPVNGGEAKAVTLLPFDEIGGVSMTPDGRRLVCAVYSSRSDVWVVDNFDASR
jgi:Tol biopolymer transport system component/DNA-binding winged helix-turn-helix (wHTH) protein